MTSAEAYLLRLGVSNVKQCSTDSDGSGNIRKNSESSEKIQEVSKTFKIGKIQ